MNTRSSAANLAQAVKDLCAEWQQIKETWHDRKTQEFEETYMEELPHHVARAGAVIAEIDGILRKVRADCE